MFRAANKSAMHSSFRQSRISARIVELLLVPLLASGMPQPACAQNPADEYQVKAAFLFHFAQLVEWPPDAPNAGDQSIALCIFDDEPHRQDLQSTLEGKVVGARVLHVRLLSQRQIPSRAATSSSSAATKSGARPRS